MAHDPTHINTLERMYTLGRQYDIYKPAALSLV